MLRTSIAAVVLGCFYFCPLDCDASVMVVDCAAVETGWRLKKYIWRLHTCCECYNKRGYIRTCYVYKIFFFIFRLATTTGVSFASILLLLLLLRRDRHFCFLVEVLLLLIIFSCWLRCCCCWCLCSLQHQYWSRETYRLLVLPSTFLSFKLRCFGRLLLLLFLAASISLP